MSAINFSPMSMTVRINFFRSLLTGLLVFGLANLSGCAGPPPRDWQINAREALEQTLENYLTGNERLAQAEFIRAQEEIATTGRIDLLARLALARCAAQVASLAAVKDTRDGKDAKVDNKPICPEFNALQEDAKEAEKVYADFLAGRWQGLPADKLPKHYRALLANQDKPGDIQQLSSIADPLARLVAASVLLQRGQLAPEGIALAVDTASSQGWRRPLLAWLGVQAQRAEAVGNRTLVAQVQRRIALVSGEFVDRK